MSKYRQDAESLLPGVAPCGDDLLSPLPGFSPKKKNQQNVQNGDSHGANVNIEWLKWCRTGEQNNDSFLVIRHAKSGIDTSLKPKYTLAVQNSV